MAIKIVSIRRKSKFESRFHPQMGHLITKVTRIQRAIFGLPYQTLHKYRDTYFGQIKDCEECESSYMAR